MASHPLEEPGISTRFIDPCILVIFGATGDLTARKLLPAIYNLAREGQLPSQFAVVGFARRDKTHEQFRQEMKDAINKFSRVKPVDEAVWKQFSNSTFSITNQNFTTTKATWHFRNFWPRLGWHVLEPKATGSSTFRPNRASSPQSPKSSIRQGLFTMPGRQRQMVARDHRKAIWTRFGFRTCSAR